ncbi:MAG TPA: sigma-70 family RNA polymerase sigma factor [Solirubrobacteraceae bacterium]|jgi:RNA polymerase sigma factor (sigma-70 family)
MSPGISTRLLATQSDERLLGLVREGHERAFEALVNRYRKPLLNYCRRLSLPEARTEDVLQQALLKTWIALRDGAEVRDIKAWLYRVVHNAAVNAVRDAVHDRERVADPTLRVGGAPADIERGLVVREALAEVAALPPLQREVIVRTAVGGYSHEQVASDLGISDGAVRGLLYRARATLRTATTALTPPPLLAWIAGRADQGSAAPERLSELAAGGGTVGLGGLLVKGGVAAVTAGTLLTGAAVVQLRSPGHHRHPRPGAIAGSLPGTGASTTGSTVAASAAVSSSRLSADAHGRVRIAGSTGAAGARSGGVALTGSQRQPRQGGTGGSTQRGAGVVQRHSGSSAPTSPGASQQVVTTTEGSSTPSAQGQTGSGAGTEAPKGGPVGSAAGSGSGSGSEGAPSGGSGSGEQAPAGSEPAGGSTSSGSESPSAPSESGSSGGSSGSESSESGQSGGLVKTVVHEVGSVLEHLLH